MRNFLRMSEINENPRTPQFGAILLRAAEMIGSQGVETLDRMGIDFDARNTSILLTLHAHGAQSSTELSRRIGHSRQLIESRLKPLLADGFLVERQDPRDARRRIYDFSEEAHEQVAQVVAIMIDFESVYDALWQEIGGDLENLLLAMERALRKKPLIDRLVEQFPGYRSTVRVSDNA